MPDWDNNINNLLFYLIPLVFIAIVIYVYRPWAKKRYQKDAEIPFEDQKTDHQNKEVGNNEPLNKNEKKP